MTAIFRYKERLLLDESSNIIVNLKRERTQSHHRACSGFQAGRELVAPEVLGRWRSITGPKPEQHSKCHKQKCNGEQHPNCPRSHFPVTLRDSLKGSQLIRRFPRTNTDQQPQQRQNDCQTTNENLVRIHSLPLCFSLHGISQLCPQ